MEKIYDYLKFVCERLNELNINYYVGGAIGAYMQANIPLFREHDDIDILIEEKYVELLNDVFKDSEFIFYDNRFISEKVLNENGYTDGEHEVIARHKTSPFHIGFFLLTLNGDEYAITEYFQENGIHKKLDKSLPMEYFKYQYSDTPVIYNGIECKTVTVEFIYKNKIVMGREKDLDDCKKLENYVDFDKMEKLKGLHKVRTTKISEV